MTIALLGASLGFLRYNFKPAKIFLGDNGSLLLGFLLASMSVLGGWAKADTLKAIIIPCAILTIPLYDITLSTILRYKNKIVKNFYEAIVYCGRDHISHRLVALGLTERESVMLLYLGGVLSGAVGAVIANENVGVSIYLPITILSIMIMIVAGIFLDKAKVYDKSLK
jgi:UDP-GlcNAc:undecaprenyl-phosphate GlcNAc-1-phosphate transferase